LSSAITIGIAADDEDDDDDSEGRIGDEEEEVAHAPPVSWISASLRSRSDALLRLACSVDVLLLWAVGRDNGCSDPGELVSVPSEFFLASSPPPASTSMGAALLPAAAVAPAAEAVVEARRDATNSAGVVTDEIGAPSLPGRSRRPRADEIRWRGVRVECASSAVDSRAENCRPQSPSWHDAAAVATATADASAEAVAELAEDDAAVLHPGASDAGPNAAVT
jgi:hypothetical protein